MFCIYKRSFILSALTFWSGVRGSGFQKSVQIRTCSDDGRATGFAVRTPCDTRRDLGRVQKNRRFRDDRGNWSKKRVVDLTKKSRKKKKNVRFSLEQQQHVGSPCSRLAVRPVRRAANNNRLARPATMFTKLRRGAHYEWIFVLKR